MNVRKSNKEMLKNKLFKQWVVDCNYHEPMLKSSYIVRDCRDGDNGIGENLMIVGFDALNPGLESGGLSYENATLIASAPFLQSTILEILPLLEQKKIDINLIKNKLANALYKSGYGYNDEMD